MTNQLPAHIANRPSRGLTQAVSQGLSSGAPPYLSIRSQRFTLIDAAGNQKPLPTLYADVVIVHANPTVSKVFYEGAFDPQATEYAPPTCYSDNGIGPSRNSQKAQSPTCANCPHNMWGSDVSRISGKATKACNDVKKLAVVMADNPDMAFLLRIPPASLKHLGAYARTIAAQSAGTRAVELSDLVTRITFDQQVQGVLNFSAVGWVDERTVAAMEKLWETKGADDLVGINDTPHPGPYALQTPGVQPQRATNQLPPPPQPAVPPVPASPQALSAPATPASPEAPRGRGRPKKEKPAQEMPAFMQASQAPAEAPPAGEIPAFLRRDQPAPAGIAVPAFGMVQNAAAPNAELAAAIDKAMNLPLPGTR